MGKAVGWTASIQFRATPLTSGYSSARSPPGLGRDRVSDDPPAWLVERRRDVYDRDIGIPDCPLQERTADSVVVEAGHPQRGTLLHSLGACRGLPQYLPTAELNPTSFGQPLDRFHRQTTWGQQVLLHAASLRGMLIRRSNCSYSRFCIMGATNHGARVFIVLAWVYPPSVVDPQDQSAAPPGLSPISQSPGDLRREFGAVVSQGEATS